MSTYSIKDLEQLSGIRTHTIRIWEQRYKLLVPKRTDTNIRYYSDNDLRLILKVALLKDFGFKISKIADMPHHRINNEVAILSDNFGGDEFITELTLAMIDMDENKFENIIVRNVASMGFEQTMIQIVYPFLHRIGILWITGSIIPAQEHFISNLIRRKIIAATDALSSNIKATKDKFVLFLPEGELHELSLLFADYMIRFRGAQSLYLGQSVPLKDVEDVCVNHQPKYVLTILTSSTWIGESGNEIKKLFKSVANATLLLSGFQAFNSKIRPAENTLILSSFEDLAQLLED